MGKVTIFKNIFDKYDPHYQDVISIFRRIKDGKSKDLIESIRSEKDKDKRQNLKKRLPSICFCGKFSQRGEKYLLEHSGLICLDVDEVRPNDMAKIRETIENDSYTHGCFISPSGNGFKIIIQMIPDKSEHKGVFLALEQYYNELIRPYKIDKSGKDVSRVCYESYDPRIYQNPDSDVWDTVLTEEVVKKSIEDENKTIELLQTWIDKQETYVEGNRNNYLSKFLYALCRYGVSDTTAKEYLSGKFPGLPAKDLAAMAKSCYSKGDFGTEEFTETQFQTYERNKKVEVKTNESIVDFWNLNDKGRVKIDTKRFLEFVEGKGFGIYQHPESVNTWEFVRKYNMIVDVVSTKDIKKVVLDHVVKHAPEPVYDELQMKNRYFERTFLNALPEINVQQVRDTPDKCYIFFEKFYYEITKDSKTKKDYVDLEGVHIWRKQICKREIETLYEFAEYKDFDFSTFLFRAMGKDELKYKAACTTLGYAIHTHKKQRLTKLVYACDNSAGELDGLLMGGSGKNLYQQCLEYVRSVTYIGGKDLDKRDRFKFQNVNQDTQLVIIDDYEGDMKDLFTRITGHFEIEKKGMDKISLPFSESPKMLVSSNKSPKGYSDSYSRRLQLLEFSDYYNEKRTPSDEFGDRDFFGEEWNQKDFDNLYSFLFDCVQLYFKEGLVKTETGDLKTKQLISNTRREFFEYWTYSCEDDMNEFQNGRAIYEDYKTQMEHHDCTIQEFYAMCRKMCKLYAWRWIDKGVGKEKTIKFQGFKSLRQT